MFNDDEIDEVFLEFRRLTRRLGGSSTPIIRDIIKSIKRATNEIRRSHWRAEDGMAEDANGGNFGGRQSRDDNSLLRHGAFSMEMTGKRSRCRFLQVTKIDVVSGIAPGNISTGLDSTPKDPVNDDRHRRIGGNQAVIEAIATYTTDKEDNRAQQNQDIPSMRGQEWGSDQEPGGRVHINNEAEPVDAETLRNDDTNQFGGKGAPTSTGLHCDGADTEHNRTQQNVPSSGGQDGEQAQEQAEEQKLRRSSRKRKSPVEDDDSGSVTDPEVRLTRQAALRARKSFSGQSAPHTPHKRRKHTRDASKGVDDLPQLESQLGNKAILTALREAKNNWALIPRTDLAMNDQPEDGASNGLSFMISLGRRLSMSPAEAWTSRILHRIRCAHFHQLYKVAIEDAGKGDESSFFRLSDELLRRHGKNPTRRHGKGFGASSAVKDRLVELILLDQRLRPQLSKDRCREVIQDVEQNGKRWSRLIQRLGYEILLLIPADFSDRK